jgi:hypothetical protein
MLGDYHAATARSAGDEREADATASAVRAWEAARSEALRIDELLATKSRQDRIERRLAAVLTPGGARGPTPEGRIGSSR